MSEGRKNDGGKPRWGLLPYDALEEVVIVLTKGADVYGDRNWESGISFDRLFSAAQRHQIAWWQNRENFDKESNLNHLAHAVAELLFLIALQQRGKNEFDNRPCPNLTIQK
jgi:hypothetical protein